MDETRRITSEFELARTTLNEKFLENPEVVDDLKDGANSFNQLRFDLSGVSSRITESIAKINSRFDGKTPLQKQDYDFLEFELEVIRGLICGNIRSEAQKYTSAVGNYMNVLTNVNRFVVLANDSANAFDKITSNLCKLSRIEQSQTQGERLADASRAYLTEAIKELELIDDELKEALKRQDPYAIGRIISSWCMRISNFIAILNATLTSPFELRDPIKSATLEAICSTLEDVEIPTVARLELEFENYKRLFGLLSVGTAIQSSLFSGIASEGLSLKNAWNNVSDLMPENTFSVSTLFTNSVNFLNDSGLDIGAALLRSADLEGFLNIDTDTASTISKAVQCINDTIENDPTKGDIATAVQKTLQDLQVAEAFGSINADTIRVRAVKNLFKEQEKLQGILGLL
jgi:hypothetical protein